MGWIVHSWVLSQPVERQLELTKLFYYSQKICWSDIFTLNSVHFEPHHRQLISSFHNVGASHQLQ